MVTSYQCFRGAKSLHLQTVILKMEALHSSETNYLAVNIASSSTYLLKLTSGSNLLHNILFR